MSKIALGLVTAASFVLAGNANAADAAKGKEVFDHWCMGCHEPLPGHAFDPPAGTYTLEQRYKGSIPSALEQRTDLKADYIKTLVRSGINVMPPSRKTEVTDADLDDVVAYLTKAK